MRGEEKKHVPPGTTVRRRRGPFRGGRAKQQSDKTGVCVQADPVIKNGRYIAVYHSYVGSKGNPIFDRTFVVWLISSSHVVDVEVVRAGGRRPDAQVMRGLWAEEQDRSKRLEESLVVLPCRARTQKKHTREPSTGMHKLHLR